jgi:transcriptional regulator with XRE-family HTH domain
MTEETIGQRLKRLREEAKLSKRRLAELSGIDRVHIIQIEGGKVKSITLRTAAALAKGLGKPPGVFFGESPELKITPKTSLADLELSINAYIPVYAEVSAGDGVEPIDWVACTRVKAAPESLRAYRVKGFCLIPEIVEGDTLIVDTAQQPTPGKLVVVIVDGQASVKRFTGDYLEDNKGKYRPDDVHAHGVVVGIYREK